METVIFTCKYFKFGSNTTGLSQSHFRNFLACSNIGMLCIQELFVFFFGGGGVGGHCGPNEILCFAEKRNCVHCICEMTVFRCDKKYQMFTLLKEKQYQVTFLCEKNGSIILHQKHQSIPNNP